MTRIMQRLTMEAILGDRLATITIIPIMKKMKLLENILLNDSTFKDPKALSIAEIAIWRIFGWFSSGLIEGFPTNFVKELKTIQMICLKVENLDFIKEWISETYHPDYVRGNYT